MENKKTKIAIVIVIILIVALIALAYIYNDFNNTQMFLLTAETSKILELDLTKNDIDNEIKTEKNYAEIEKAVKEYIGNIKDIYIEMEEMTSGINPNEIFTAENMQDENLEKIDKIISDYKEKSQNFITEYENLVADEAIENNFNNIDILIRKSYYKNLYNEIMLNEAMKTQYDKLEEEIKNQKGKLYEKLNKVEKMKNFLGEHKDSWTIKENKIQFTNLNRMTEYYNLLNQIILD